MPFTGFRTITDGMEAGLVRRRGLQEPLTYSKIANWACRPVSHDRRRISPALMMQNTAIASVTRIDSGAWFPTGVKRVEGIGQRR